MCTSTPKLPPPAPPQQEQKMPDTVNARAKRNRAGQGGTLLTGAGGLAGGSMNTGGATLLGG